MLLCVVKRSFAFIHLSSIIIPLAKKLEMMQQNNVNLIYPQSVRVGFDFYGAGNIGDDLMVAGFVESIKSLYSAQTIDIKILTKGDIQSQKTRFPELVWIERNGNFHYASFLDSLNCWAGVGDTPFQLTCGPWLLRSLTDDLKNVKDFSQKVLINVGAETAILKMRDQFSNLANFFDRISVRDAHTYDILSKDLSVPEEKLFLSSDLANISLPSILSKQNPPVNYGLGLIIAGDALKIKDLSEVKKFIECQKEEIAFIAGETRFGPLIRNGYSFRKTPIYERRIFEEISKSFKSKVSQKAKLLVPNYQSGSLYDLIAPICVCDSIITTRYHGLLAAAWAGCKVSAIGRSSKVSALAELLNIPYVELPITLSKLEFLKENSVKVSRERLEDLRDKALEGVSFALAQNL